MAPPQKQAHFPHRRIFPLTLPASSPIEDEEPEVTSPILMDGENIKELPSSALPTPQPAPPLLFSKRCSIRGCVFEVSGPAKFKCWIHELMEKEPEKFCTLQPTGWILELARYGVTTEDEDLHIRQIIRAKAVRRAFLEGVA